MRHNMHILQRTAKSMKFSSFSNPYEEEREEKAK